MSQNWFAKLLHRFLGQPRQPQKTTSLRLRKLEDRRLLNADFTLVGTDLTLFDFDGTDLEVSDGMADVGNGNEAVYIFELDAGEDWLSGDIAGVADVSANMRTLTVAQSAVETLLIEDSGFTSDVAVTFADGGASSIDLSGLTSVTISDAGNIGLGSDDDVSISTLILEDVGTVTLDDADSDFDTIEVTGGTTVADLTIVDTDEIELNGITSAAAIDVTAGGTITVSGALDATGNNIDLVATNGGVTIQDDLTASNIDITGEGAISQDAATVITAAELSVEQTDVTADVDIDLCEDNAVDQFAADNDSAGGEVSFHSVNALTVGDVNGVTGVTTDNGNVSLESTMNLTIDNAITVGSGDIALDSGMTLDVNVALSTTGDVLLDTESALALDQAITGTEVRIITDGALTQTNAGLITATTLGVRQESLDETIDITLAMDNVVTNFAAFNASDGGAVTFLSTQPLSISAVTATTQKNATFAATTGVTTTSVGETTNDVLIESGGSLAINQAINAGPADVRLVANDQIAQNATGIITANELGVRQLNAGANFDVILCEDNVVDEFAADNASDGGAVRFRSTLDLEIGALTAVTVDNASFAATTGVTSDSGDATGGGPVEIETDGNLTLTDTVNSNGGDLSFITGGMFDIVAAINIPGSDLFISAGTGGIDIDFALTADTIRLVANGAITQTAVVTATTLGVRQEAAGANLDVTLALDNVVDNFAAFNASDGGSVAFNSTQPLTITNVGAGTAGTKAANFTATNGISTTGATTNDILVETDGALTINGQLNATTAADVRLLANGAITQNAAGIITADELGVRQRNTAAGNDIVLCENNVVSEFAADNASDDAAIRFLSTSTLDIGSVTGSTVGNITFAAVTGVTSDSTNATGGGPVEIASGGDLTLTDTVNSNGGDLSLIAGGTFDLQNAISLPGSELFISIGTGGFDIDNALTAETIRLIANGAITQSAIVTAMNFGVRQEAATANTDVTLGLDNLVDNFAAFNASDGGAISFNNAQALTISTVASGAAATKAADFTTTNGVSTTSGANTSNDILIGSSSTLTLDQQVNATSNADVRLVANGTITQSATGNITADVLGVRQQDATANTDITLGENNTVSGLTAINNSDGGDIVFNSNQSLTISTLAAATAQNVSFAATTGVVSTSAGDTTNDILIETDGALTINQVINATQNADVRLIANGAVTQNATGIITADELGIRQRNAGANINVDLCEANVVSELAADNDSNGGFVSFSSSEPLTVGSVTASAVQSINFAQVDGVTTNNGAVELESTGNLTIDDAITVGSGNISLDSGAILDFNVALSTTGDILLDTESALTIDQTVSANDVFIITNGAVSQTLTGLITTTGILGVRQEAVGANLNVDLAFDNSVAAFTAFNASDGGRISLNSTQSLTITSVGLTTQKNVAFAATNGVSTTSVGNTTNDILIETDGSLAVNGQLNATQNADVRLLANGDVTQNANGIITANELGVRQRNLGAGNDVVLCEDNVVDEFAADNASNGGAVRFLSTLDLNIGSITAATVDNISFAALTGVTSDSGDALGGGPIELQSGGNLTITDSVNSNGGDLSLIAGGTFDITSAITLPGSDLFISIGTGGLDVDFALTADTIRLVANGAITQSALITATSLGVRQESAGANLDIDLGLANGVSNFTAFNASAGGDVTFCSVLPLTVGNVGAAVGKGVGFQATAGVTTNDGNIAIESSGNLTINNAIVAGSGDISLDSGAMLDLNSSITTTGDVLLDTESALSIDQTITAGNLRIVADGAVMQTAIITATTLGVRQESALANLDIDLSLANVVDNFAAFNASDGGDVTFCSTQPLTVGTAGSATMKNATFTQTLGVTTNNGTVALESLGDLTINNSINVGSGDISLDSGASLDVNVSLSTTGTVLLDTESPLIIDQTINGGTVLIVADGAVSQTAIITATTLGVRQESSTANLDIDLSLTNVVDNFAAFNASDEGNVTFCSNQTLTVGTAGPLTIKNATFTQTDGVTTNNGDITIETAGNLLLTDPVDANGGDLSLIAGGTFDLAAPINTPGSDLFISVGTGGFDIDFALTAETIRLIANGDITQSALVTATTLGVRQENTTGDLDIALGENNLVTNFAAFNASDRGQITFNTSSDLVVGAVAEVTAKSATFTRTVGVQSTLTSGAVTESESNPLSGDVADSDDGDILLNSGGSVTFDQVVRAGGTSEIDPNLAGQDLTARADIRVAATSTITQTLDTDPMNLQNGILLANELGLRVDSGSGGGDILLNVIENRVDSIAAFNDTDGGEIRYFDADNLQINFVTDADLGGQPVEFIRTDGITAAGGDIEVQAGGSLSVVGYTDGFANPRNVTTADGTIDSGAGSGETISLTALNGNLRLGRNVLISTDEDLTAGAFSNDTGDQILINTSGRFIVDPNVVLRTDGGLANTFARRPDVVNPLVSGDMQNPAGGAFFSLKVEDALVEQMGGAVAEFDVVVGVTGEENLTIEGDFNPPVGDGAASDFGATMVAGDTLFTFNYLYTDADLNVALLLGDPLVATFNVQHHTSIEVTGSQVVQNGANQAVDPLLLPIDGNQGNLSRSDDGAAVFTIDIPPAFVIIEPDAPPVAFAPQPAFVPTPDIPPASPTPPPIPASSKASISTESYDFFELRRAGEDKPIVEFISEAEGDSLLDPKRLAEFIEEEGIGDENDYELWLITQKIKQNGQPIRIERIILKFDVINGEPIPAVDELESEFPELKLVPIDVDGNPIEQTDEIPLPDLSEEEPNNSDEEIVTPPTSESDDQPAQPDEEEGMAIISRQRDAVVRHEMEKESQQLAGSLAGAVAIAAATRRRDSSHESRKTRTSSLLGRFFGRKTG